MEKKAFFGNSDVINWQMQSSEAGELQNLSSGHLNLIWDQAIDQTAMFDSAISSHVSSPSSNPPAGGDSVVIRELIGRLGTICNSDEISQTSSHYQSANNSCYSTPMNSPPKLNLSFVANPTHMPFPADPGFAERAARCSTFSCSAGTSHGAGQFMLPDAGKLGNAVEETSASGNTKKRKATPKGKGKEASLSSSITTRVGIEGSNGKRNKPLLEEVVEEKDSEEQQGNAATMKMEEEKGTKSAELSKDYIHVRARRGQATDSHSLAERVRREKISERMKLLQDLVPGCNKVTGKAVMLDEIINYVQSLQRQVEFLSMKLATVNPQLDFNMENFVNKNIEIQQNSGILQPHSLYPLETISSSFSPLMAINGLELENQGIPFLGHSTNLSRNQPGLQSNCLDSFPNSSYQIEKLWDDDLQNVVQMGFSHNQELVFSTKTIVEGPAGTNHMKVEL